MSKILIEIYLLGVPKGLIIGWYFNGGDIISCFCKSFNLIYSSKYILISLELKLVVNCNGFALTNIGASSSFGPPSGLPLRAQSINTTIKKTRTTIKENCFFIFKICCKLTIIFNGNTN